MNDQARLQRRSLVLALLGLGAGFAQSARAQSAGQMLDELAKVAAAKRAGLPTNIGAIDQATLKPLQSDAGTDPVRAALAKAVREIGTRLGKPDGFWGDARIRISLPAPLDALQGRLTALRMGASLDSFQLSLNRAAALVMPEAQAQLIGALNALPLETAQVLIKSEKATAMDLLLTETRPSLLLALKPKMAEAVAASGAGALLDRIQSRYGGEIKASGGWSGLNAYSPDPIHLPTPKAAVDAAPSQAMVSNKPLHNQLVGYILDQVWRAILLYLAEALRPPPA
jgi:hypothetical protein